MRLGSLDESFKKFLQRIVAGYDSSDVTADRDGAVMERQEFLMDRQDELEAELEILEDHIHSVQQCAPMAGAPITVTSGVGAWTLGNYSNDILASMAVSDIFDIHHVIISDPDANEDYELVLYGGETEIACVPFTRGNNFVNSIQLPIITPMQAAGTQIRAKLRDSNGGSACNVKVLFHEY